MSEALAALNSGPTPWPPFRRLIQRLVSINRLIVAALYSSLSSMSGTGGIRHQAKVLAWPPMGMWKRFSPWRMAVNRRDETRLREGSARPIRRRNSLT